MPVLFVCLDTFVQCFLYSASRVRASDHFQIMQDCKTFMTRFRVGNLRRSSDIDDWAVRDGVGDGLMIE